MPMTAPMPPSNCWRAARSARVPHYFDVLSFRVIVEQRGNAK